MPKVFSFIIIAILILIPFLQTPTVLGASCSLASATFPDTSFTGEDLKISVKFTSLATLKSEKYRLLVTTGEIRNPWGTFQDLYIDGKKMYEAGQNTVEFTLPGGSFDKAANYSVKLQNNLTLLSIVGSGTGSDVCDFGTISILDKDFANLENKCKINMSKNYKEGEEITGTVLVPDTDRLQFELSILAKDVTDRIPKTPVYATAFRSIAGTYYYRNYTKNSSKVPRNLERGESTLSLKEQQPNPLGIGTYTAYLLASSANLARPPFYFYCVTKIFTVSRNETSTVTPGVSITAPGAIIDGVVNFKPDVKSCDEDSRDCTTSKPIPCPGSEGIMTAIGCVPTEPKALVEGLLKYGTFAAGGVAFLIMILASLQMITAEGNPESIKAGQEKFYSAIIGLLLIIFAVLLMQVIGVDILGLPGFNNPLPRGSTT